MPQTADRNAPMRDTGRSIDLAMAATTEIFKGALVAVDAAGHALPAADTAGLKVVGVADEHVNNTGAAAAKTIQVFKGVVGMLAGGSPPVQADIGRVVYVSTDQKVEIASGVTNDVEAGTLDSIRGSLYWVKILDQIEITTAVIPDGSITTAKLAALAVTTAKINALAVTAAELGALAVTTAKIDNLAVTAAKLGALAVETAKLDALAVTNAKIAATAVDDTKLDFFASVDVSGTGSSQNIAHGLGRTPGIVLFMLTEFADTLAVDIAEGAHDGTNIVVTVTSGAKFSVLAL